MNTEQVISATVNVQKRGGLYYFQLRTPKGTAKDHRRGSIHAPQVRHLFGSISGVPDSFTYQWSRMIGELWLRDIGSAGVFFAHRPCGL